MQIRSLPLFWASYTVTAPTVKAVGFRLDLQKARESALGLEPKGESRPTILPKQLTYSGS